MFASLAAMGPIFWYFRQMEMASFWDTQTPVCFSDPSVALVKRM
jgi:hypothetical protein